MTEINYVTYLNARKIAARCVERPYNMGTMGKATEVIAEAFAAKDATIAGLRRELEVSADALESAHCVIVNCFDSGDEPGAPVMSQSTSLRATVKQVKDAADTARATLEATR